MVCPVSRALVMSFITSQGRFVFASTTAIGTLTLCTCSTQGSHSQRALSALLAMSDSSNQAVQPTGASRLARRQIERQRRLAPVADLFVGCDMKLQSVLLGKGQL